MRAASLRAISAPERDQNLRTGDPETGLNERRRKREGNRRRGWNRRLRVFNSNEDGLRCKEAIPQRRGELQNRLPCEGERIGHQEQALLKGRIQISLTFEQHEGPSDPCEQHGEKRHADTPQDQREPERRSGLLRRAGDDHHSPP
jgi:hypothetical protein